MAGEMLKITTDELEKLISANTIVGDPLDAGNKTFIPVASFGFGFGSAEGGGTGKGEQGEGSGQAAGSGAGGGVMPVAVIVLHQDVKGMEGVQVMLLKKSNMFAEVLGTFGEEVLSHMVNCFKCKICKPEEEEGEEIKISEE